jgi:hypothetical protein
MPMTRCFSPWSKFNAHNWAVLNARRHGMAKWVAKHSTLGDALLIESMEDWTNTQHE